MGTEVIRSYLSHYTTNKDFIMMNTAMEYCSMFIDECVKEFPEEMDDERLLEDLVAWHEKISFHLYPVCSKHNTKCESLLRNRDRNAWSCRQSRPPCKTLQKCSPHSSRSTRSSQIGSPLRSEECPPATLCGWENRSCSPPPGPAPPDCPPGGS